MQSLKPAIVGTKCVVASGHYLATTAGMRIAMQGGNAVDAGVAAGLALAVLKPHENTLGGECPILIHSPITKKVAAISGQGYSPAVATTQWFRKNGIAVIPGDGFLCATVPALFGAYCTALRDFGTKSLAEVLEPAIELAAGGFPVYDALRDSIAANTQRFKNQWPSTAGIFLPDGTIPQTGTVLKQTELAHLFRRLVAAEGTGPGGDRVCGINRAVNAFYNGETVDAILSFAKKHPCSDSTGRVHTTLLERDDFSSYRTRIEPPLFTDHRDTTVFKCGPWTQGPVFLQQLKLLEGFDLRATGHNSADYVHLLTECAKRAFADRETWYGDPDFSTVPLDRLLSPGYNNAQRLLINRTTADNSALWTPSIIYGNHQGDTTHVDTADNTGLMMSATPSGGWIPSSPVIPGLGFPLGTRAQIFNLIDGHPNCIQPRKRPRTTLTPSIALRNGKPFMAFGTQGGDMQDQLTLQFFLNVIDFGMTLQDAIDAPTFDCLHFPGSFYPHTFTPGKLSVEADLGQGVIDELKKRGHVIDTVSANSKGQVTAVSLDHEKGTITGAASGKYDRQAQAAGW